MLKLKAKNGLLILMLTVRQAGIIIRRMLIRFQKKRSIALSTQLMKNIKKQSARILTA
jgi:hypothetical protein